MRPKKGHEEAYLKNKLPDEGKVAYTRRIAGEIRKDGAEYIERWKDSSNEDLSAHYGIAISSIRALNNFFSLKREYPAQDINMDEYKKDWEVLSNTKLAKKYNVSINTIKLINRKLGSKPTGRSKNLEAWREERREKSIVGTKTLVKTSDRKEWKILTETGWMGLHRHLWLEKHGSIPDGYVVCFKNGNPEDCVIENLEILTRRELARKWGSGGARQLSEGTKKEREERRAIREAERREKMETILLEAEKRRQELKEEARTKKQAAADKKREEWAQRKLQEEKDRRDALLKKRMEKEEKLLAANSKKEVYIFPTIQRDWSSFRSVKVDNKTTIQIRADEDPEQAIIKYFQNHKIKKAS